MLTKDLLRVRRRGNKIYPQFCDPKDQDLLESASFLIDAVEDSIGLTMGDLEETLSDLELAPEDIINGLKKLLIDRLEICEDDGSTEEFRWQVLTKAEELRNSIEAQNTEDFDEQLSRSVGLDADTIRKKLYGDLPENRAILGFDSIAPEALLHRWNCAQVQGLLLRAVQVKLTIGPLTISEKRSLFRQLKFYRLLSQVESLDPSEGTDMISPMTIHLSGPMSLFDQAQNYGLRLAQFFPYILHCNKYSVDAEVKWQNSEYHFKIDEKCGIKSHYKQKEPYIPPELVACLESFNSKKRGISAASGDAFVHIGRESYCFPDITITFKDTGRQIHIELFHRWHLHQLKQRIEALEKNPHPDYRFGVCRSIAKQVDSHVKESDLFLKKGFWFRDFPTPHMLLGLLDLS